MPNLREEMDLYLQELLSLQYKSSNNISHKPTKGMLREKFIKQIVVDEYPNLKIQSGILIDGNWQSTQGDFIWLKDNARVGLYDCYELADCQMFIEIKSNAKHSEFVHLNDLAQEIHRRISSDESKSRIVVGAFCYSTEASYKTILRKFGFKYDNELQGFLNYDKEYDIFPNIDFLVSLNIADDYEESPYIVVRDIYGNCVLYNYNPIIKYFLNYFKIS